MTYDLIAESLSRINDKLDVLVEGMHRFDLRLQVLEQDLSRRRSNRKWLVGTVTALGIAFASLFAKAIAR